MVSRARGWRAWSCVGVLAVCGSLGWHAGPPSEEEPLDPLPVDGTDAEATLAWIAAEYSAWPRATDYLHWSPLDCRAPAVRGEWFAASASEDEGTHGRKLYHLYARDVWGYIASVPWWDTVDQREDRRLNPIGQVLVKEAWHPVEVAPGERDEEGRVLPPAGRDSLENLVFEGERWYEPGERADLFIMYRMERGTPGTDEGWLYGVVTPGEHPVVTSFGLIESCMGCHQESENDRMLGMWREPGDGGR